MYDSTGFFALTLCSNVSSESLLSARNIVDLNALII